MAPAAWANGSLLVVGGALSEDNAEVHRALIDAMPPDGPMIIVGVASGQPAKSAESFINALVKHGLDRQRTRVYPLAVKDDSGTPGVDEGSWRDNAWNADEVEKISRAAGFWFTGGDQSRITAALVGPKGEESPLLKLIRKRVDEGAVIGGTSAGAAIMGRHMIAGGESFIALLTPPASATRESLEADDGRLLLANGLGFLDGFIVDQHFDRRARLGRLARALAATGQTRGIGIDEDTAVLVQPAADRARVLGQGSVTLLDSGEAKFAFKSGELATGLRLSSIASGVSFRLSDASITSGRGKPTVGNEYYDFQPRRGGGIALANARLEQVLGNELMDNRGAGLVERYSIDIDAGVLIYRFVKTPQSQGFWDSGAGSRYSVTNVRFDILSRSLHEAFKSGQNPAD
jgi:cyanophycinase